MVMVKKLLPKSNTMKNSDVVVATVSTGGRSKILGAICIAMWTTWVPS